MFTLQQLISESNNNSALQALGSEIYTGTASGDLVRYALDEHHSYTVLARVTIPSEKPIDDIVIIPSLSRLLVQADRQIYFYALPSLDPINIKPVRNVLTFAVDHRHLQRPPVLVSDPVEFSVIKRTGIAMFSLRNDKLFYQKEIPLPPGSPLALKARRIGHSLCFADNEYYNMVDLEQASLFQLLPLRQTVDPTPWKVEPLITVIGENEFLITSWTGASALGVFITGDGDPVRGTLEWAGYPKAVCLDYPYIASLLPNDAIEVHSVETQSIVQVLENPPESMMMGLIPSLHGFFVPLTRRSEKMRRVKIPLVRTQDGTH